jgi:hypothetical protein
MNFWTASLQADRQTFPDEPLHTANRRLIAFHARHVLQNLLVYSTDFEPYHGYRSYRNIMENFLVVQRQSLVAYMVSICWPGCMSLVCRPISIFVAIECTVSHSRNRV